MKELSSSPTVFVSTCFSRFNQITPSIPVICLIMCMNRCVVFVLRFDSGIVAEYESPHERFDSFDLKITLRALVTTTTSDIHNNDSFLLFSVAHSVYMSFLF